MSFLIMNLRIWNLRDFIDSDFIFLRCRFSNFTIFPKTFAFAIAILATAMVYFGTFKAHLTCVKTYFTDIKTHITGIKANFCIFVDVDIFFGFSFLLI